MSLWGRKRYLVLELRRTGKFVNMCSELWKRRMGNRTHEILRPHFRKHRKCHKISQESIDY